MLMQWNSPEESYNWLLFFSLIHVADINCASLVFGPMPFYLCCLKRELWCLVSDSNFDNFHGTGISTPSKDLGPAFLGQVLELRSHNFGCSASRVGVLRKLESPKLASWAEPLLPFYGRTATTNWNIFSSCLSFGIFWNF